MGCSEQAKPIDPALDRGVPLRVGHGIGADPWTQVSHDAISCSLWVLMLPDTQHMPAKLMKSLVAIPIAFLVLPQFLTPPFGICLRLGAMNRACMPETAIDENS